MRRRCGCTARSAMVLTSAKAMSASDRRFSRSSRIMVAKLSPTALSVSLRLRTRSTMLENLGSLGRSGCARTSAHNFFHSRSLWIEREWKKLCADVLAQPDLPNDPRFSNMVERVRNRKLTDKAVGDSFATMMRDDLLKRLSDAD